jgi:hypothetical protein
LSSVSYTIARFGDTYHTVHRLDEFHPYQPDLLGDHLYLCLCLCLFLFLRLYLSFGSLRESPLHFDSVMKCDLFGHTSDKLRLSTSNLRGHAAFHIASILSLLAQPG